jgi:acid stress-induced BolA-like protein IbaG/YrbA
MDSSLTDKITQALVSMNLDKPTLEIKGKPPEIFVTLISSSFTDMDEAERQKRVWTALREILNSNERDAIEFVFTVSPDDPESPEDKDLRSVRAKRGLTKLSEMLARLVVIDVETSGTRFVANQLLSVAFVPLLMPDRILELYVRHGEITWEDRAREFFQRYKHRWDSEAIPLPDACRAMEVYAVREFGGPFTIVGHNVAFDFAFLRAAFHRAGIDEARVFSHRSVDTHTLLFGLVLQGRLPESVLNSSGAFSYFGISPPESERHTAVGDAHATRLLLQEVLRLYGIAVPIEHS